MAPQAQPPHGAALGHHLPPNWSKAMNTIAADTFGSTARKRWAIVMPAVFLMYTISFFDRVNIGMALPYITKEMNLTSVQGGWVGAAFAWGYLITQLSA